MGRSVPTEDVCYFTLVVDKTRTTRVRYGLARRANCQVEVDRERWEAIAARLRSRGYRLIERPGKRRGRSPGRRDDAANGGT